MLLNQLPRYNVFAVVLVLAEGKARIIGRFFHDFSKTTVSILGTPVMFVMTIEMDGMHSSTPSVICNVTWSDP